MTRTKVNPRDVLVDESKQHDIENLGDCLRALGDGQSLGDFSLTIVMYATTKGELDQLVGEFSGVFSNADGNLFVETYNQLNAYFAVVPGNYCTKLTQALLVKRQLRRPVFLFYDTRRRETQCASGRRISRGARNRQCDTVLPQPAQWGSTAHIDSRHDRKWQKLFLQFVLQNAQKYNPLTFIFDIGGSFQSLTRFSAVPI
jgi:hypothetical protein